MRRPIAVARLNLSGCRVLERLRERLLSKIFRSGFMTDNLTQLSFDRRCHLRTGDSHDARYFLLNSTVGINNEL